MAATVSRCPRRRARIERHGADRIGLRDVAEKSRRNRDLVVTRGGVLDDDQLFPVGGLTQ